MKPSYKLCLDTVGSFESNPFTKGPQPPLPQTVVVDYTDEEFRELVKSGGESITFYFPEPITVKDGDTLIVIIEFTMK